MFGRSTTKRRDAHDDRHDDRYDRRTDPAAADQARKDRFGGMNIGAAFFGWLVAVAVSALLTGIIGAVAAAAGSQAQVIQSQAQKQVGSIGLAAALVLLVVLVVGYYCGGYVAGRMSRFSGSRQGIGVWLIGLLVGIITVVLGAVFGQQYDVMSRVNLPRLPVSFDALTAGGVVAALIVLAATLFAAILGGSVGTHYHRRVDKAGYRA